MTTTWFTENRTLVYFVYGLVFFILGIVILLQTRSYSRLHLARSLPWLGWFGISHGLYEWGDIFIPIQTHNMGESFFSIFDFSQHTLLASFVLGTISIRDRITETIQQDLAIYPPHTNDCVGHMGSWTDDPWVYI